MHKYLLLLNSGNLSLLFSINALRLIKMRAEQSPSEGTLEGTIAKGPVRGLGGNNKSEVGTEMTYPYPPPSSPHTDDFFELNCIDISLHFTLYAGFY